MMFFSLPSCSSFNLIKAKIKVHESLLSGSRIKKESDEHLRVYLGYLRLKCFDS
jgi:hypothetical protein